MRRKHLERGIKGEYMALGVIAEKAKQKCNDPNGMTFKGAYNRTDTPFAYSLPRLSKKLVFREREIVYIHSNGIDNS
jgi:hypothetical protein